MRTDHVDLGTIAAACVEFLAKFNDSKVTAAVEFDPAIDELLDALDLFHHGTRPR